MWLLIFYYHSQNPTDGSAVTYQIFDEYVAYDFNWFILTSKVTFSAANLMAATAKEQGIATVIGLKSSGGASSISGTVLPTGDVIFISSTNVISTRDTEGDYISVEYGVDPDILFPGVSSLYNDEYIQEVVNNSLLD
jgi:C-terminal processing protease CtpA/Prc